MTQAPLTPRRWRRVEYERLVDLGVFENDPIELIGGQLVVAEPHGTYHAAAISAIDYAVRTILPPGWIVRSQLPVSLDDDSAPEPDVAVVLGRPADYRESHPSRPVLIVEVAETSLAFDRQHKASLYARGGIEDYWIVNLVDRVLEVHRDPMADDTAIFGWQYQSVIALTRAELVVPLAFTSARLAVAELFP
jgi:Uma2 family endonuclease